MSVSLWGYDPAHCDGHECVKDCDRCPYNVEQNLYEFNEDEFKEKVKSIRIEPVEDSQPKFGAPCIICGETIPIYFPSGQVPHFCDECRKRIKRILYPPEVYIDGIKLSDDVTSLLQHVGYDDAQLGREK